MAILSSVIVEPLIDFTRMIFFGIFETNNILDSVENALDKIPNLAVNCYKIWPAAFLI